jgi:hypothetical protein
MSGGGEESRHGRHLNWRVLGLAIAGAAIVLFLAANAHLVYVALATQPDCVPHAKSPGKDGSFRAARSAC